MNRRAYLTLGVGGLATLAGCGEVSTDEPPQENNNTTPEPTAEQEQEPDPVQTEPTPTEIDAEEREFLLNAFRLELIRTGIMVEDVDGNESIEVQYFTSGGGSEAAILGETLTITDAFLSELLNQGYFPNFLQVWVIDPDTREDLRWYNIQPDWVIEWFMNEITTAQYLAKIDNTVEEL